MPDESRTEEPIGEEPRPGQKPEGPEPGSEEPIPGEERSAQEPGSEEPIPGEERSAQEPGSEEPIPGEEPESVWTYRGYHLEHSDFTTAMVHLFRGEIARSNTWRMRLDATTNWAVITTGLAISVAFTSADVNEHGVIILTTLLVTLFLAVEARRYRYYELWSYRVRLMETDFFAAMLVPPFRPAFDWAETLADNLLQPTFPISRWEAWGRRFRRNYMWIYILLGLAWVLKLMIHPTPATSWDEFVTRAAVGSVSGWAVITAGLIFNTVLMIVGLLTIGLQQATGEVLPRYSTMETLGGLSQGAADQLGRQMRPSHRRNQLVALVITDYPRQVSDRVLDQMVRGVTRLPGEGMFTGRERSVLMTALTATEVKQFEALVKEGDPAAFVMVVPAQEVMGAGFTPLEQAEHEKAGRL